MLFVWLIKLNVTVTTRWKSIYGCLQLCGGLFICSITIQAKCLSWVVSSTDSSDMHPISFKGQSCQMLEYWLFFVAFCFFKKLCNYQCWLACSNWFRKCDKLLLENSENWAKPAPFLPGKVSFCSPQPTRLCVQNHVEILRQKKLIIYYKMAKSIGQVTTCSSL